MSLRGLREPKNDMCTCGHTRVNHNDTQDLGHGECLAENCRCKRYTWTSKENEKWDDFADGISGWNKEEHK